MNFDVKNLSLKLASFFQLYKQYNKISLSYFQINLTQLPLIHSLQLQLTLDHLMGTVCVQDPYLRNYNVNTKSKDQINWKKARQISSSQYAKLVYAYQRHYGYIVGNDARQFIQKNYNPNYKSTTKMLNGSSTTTYRYQIQDRLKTANSNSLITFHTSFEDLDQSQRTIQYLWQVKNQLKGGITNYKVTMTFDEQNRFLTGTFQEYLFEHQKSRPVYQPPKIKQSYNFNNSSSNNFNGPKDHGIDYSQQLQKSNDQFRQNMNKQAQQWNDYARQKNNRGQ